MTDHRAVSPVMAALAAGLPLTLLADLADPAGPDSRHILLTETADMGWLHGLAYPTVEPGAGADRTAV